MANEVLYKVGTSFVVANSDYSGGTNTILGTYSATYDIDVASLADGSARQSIKWDWGATRPMAFKVRQTVELSADPASAGTIDLYAYESHSVTAAVGNTGGCSGADGAYTGYSGHTLAEALNQLDFIGSLITGVQNDTDGVVIGSVGVYSPTARYGGIVIVNNSNIILHSDAIEAAVLFEPIVTEIQ
jgi:hypothetical protein